MREVNDQATEEVEEVLEEEIWENVEKTMYNPKDDRLEYQIQNHNAPGTYWNNVDEVYGYFNQDHLFTPTDNNNSTTNEEAPAFLGMTLTANDGDDDDETPESGTKDMDDEDQETLPHGFDVNNPSNILATAIYQAALARTSTDAGSKSWLKSVRVKLKICGISMSTKYQELFGASAVGSNPTKYSMTQDINNCIYDNHF